MFCHFQCTSLVFPWLNFFVNILFFDPFINEIVFLISFSDCSSLVCRKSTNVCVVFHCWGDKSEVSNMLGKWFNTGLYSQGPNFLYTVFHYTVVTDFMQFLKVGCNHYVKLFKIVLVLLNYLLLNYLWWKIRMHGIYINAVVTIMW